MYSGDCVAASAYGRGPALYFTFPYPPSSINLDYPYQVGQIEWWIDNQLKNSGGKSIF